MIRIRQTRRNFLRTAGGLAIVGLFDPARTVSEAWSSTSAGTAGPSRIAVFFEEGFPGIDHFHLDRAVLGEALRGIGTPDIIGVDFLTSAQLGTGIDRSSYRLFVNPYGSAFPLEAWGAIRQFLSTGGNLLNLGGAPFSVAVNRRPDGTWEHGYPRTTYHRELGITQSFRVAASRIPDGPVSRYVDLSGDPDGKGLADLIRVDEACELYVRFTSTRDYPGEDGTAGQRDAQIRAEVGGFDAAGDLIVAPVVRIDRLLGEFSGGRWILANFTGSLTPAAVGNLAGRALGPVVHPSVEPTFATYLQGETPAFALRTPDPSRGFSGRMAGAWSVMLSDAAGKTIFRTTFRDDPPGGRYVLPRETARKLAPGLHTVGCTFTPADGKQSGSERITAENGFWIMDGKLLSSGRGLTAGERYFSHGDIPYPVVGTSYMSEGVQRKFLFEPNPVLWDRDFREMKRSGINLIRTGIWTGWKNIMLDAGRLDETVLRALDAFVLTAARYDIPVVFTFFSFLPESWGGENPYLDPRAVQAQSIFLSAIARRYAGAPGVIWDLINEPSFSSPDHLWECRPNYDVHERKAWADWFAVRHHETGKNATAERFRLIGGEQPGLPELKDFTDGNIIGATKPFLAHEYRIFAQEQFRLWARAMRDVLRKDAGSAHLVTVGQDEGATSDRPGPHFFGDEVDFTSMHNWWYNDDLLWDSLMTSVPGKANLIEETGVMFYETAGGRPWRTEANVRDLVERKLAMAFASGAAGFVNWLWNSNPYMDSDNEAGIGLKRADGTHKPEFGSVRRFSRFFSENARLMSGKEEEQAVMVIPHSNLFSNRNTATEGTRACVRAMEYHCRIPMRAVSEYGLQRLKDPPALLVLPSPAVFDSESWGRLKSLVGRGGTLLVSGPFDRDRYHLPADRMAALGLPSSVEPVGAEEFLIIDGKEHRLGFRGEKMQRVEKCADASGTVPSVMVVPAGTGRIVFSPIPLELSDSIEAVAAFYRCGISAAGITGKIIVDTDDPSVLVRTIVYEKSIMVTLIPEAEQARKISFTLRESARKHTVEVPARRPAVYFYNRADGSLLSALESTADRH